MNYGLQVASSLGINWPVTCAAWTKTLRCRNTCSCCCSRLTAIATSSKPWPLFPLMLSLRAAFVATTAATSAALATWAPIASRKLGLRCSRYTWDTRWRESEDSVSIQYTTVCYIPGTCCCQTTSCSIYSIRVGRLGSALYVVSHLVHCASTAAT